MLFFLKVLTEYFGQLGYTRIKANFSQEIADFKLLLL